ncbi:MAG: sigma-70 family RNA polymerase sigma factor [Planctomycetota bacterium]
MLAAFCRGDAAAFEALYDRHHGFVLRVARRFCGDDDEALDVLQETFAWLVRKAPGLQLRHRLTTLLYPVAKHLAADRRRKRARGPQPAGATRDLVEPAVEVRVEGDLRDWFVDLGPLQQEILALRFADDLSLDEIAAALDIPVGTAKSRLHNALTQLRDRSEGTEPGSSSSFRRAPEKPATD